jgi:hypothetical protein
MAFFLSSEKEIRKATRLKRDNVFVFSMKNFRSPIRFLTFHLNFLFFINSEDL